jgi:hypothetical protein
MNYPSAYDVGAAETGDSRADDADVWFRICFAGGHFSAGFEIRGQEVIKVVEGSKIQESEGCEREARSSKVMRARSSIS